eukprot:6181895-Pleurochrysis_carterae.AAC.3
MAATSLQFPWPRRRRGDWLQLVLRRARDIWKSLGQCYVLSRSLLRLFEHTKCFTWSLAYNQPVSAVGFWGRLCTLDWLQLARGRVPDIVKPAVNQLPHCAYLFAQSAQNPTAC